MLSLCMMVRDEEAMLPDCLASVQGVADEIIVVDTGSRDSTPAIARQYGARVELLTEWDGDFAKARNRSLELAKGDWILVLDADERLDPETAAKLPAFLAEGKEQAYSMEILNLTGQGEGRQYAQIVRLFRNRPEFRYERAIHEQILPAIMRQGHEAPATTLRIIHHGYLDSALKARNKYQRNLELLLKETSRHPEDAYNHFCLGQTYKLMGNLDSAKQHYSECLRLLKGQGTPYDAYLYFSYADLLYRAGDYEEALELVHEGLVKYPNYSDLTYVKGQILISQGKIHNAKGCFKRCLELARFRHSGGTDPGTSSYKALSALGICHEQLGEIDQALVQLDAAIKASPPGEVDALLNRGMLLSKVGQYQAAERDFREVLAWGDRPEAWQNLGIAAMKQGNLALAKDAFQKVLTKDSSVLLGEIALLERNLLDASRHFAAGDLPLLAGACRFFAKAPTQADWTDEERGFQSILDGLLPQSLSNQAIPAWEKILEIAIRLESYEILEQFANKSHPMWAKHPGMALMLASLLERQGFIDAACEVALDLQKLHPEEAQVYRILGRLCQKQGLDQDAEEMFHRAELLENSG